MLLLMIRHFLFTLNKGRETQKSHRDPASQTETGVSSVLGFNLIDLCRAGLVDILATSPLNTSLNAFDTAKEDLKNWRSQIVTSSFEVKHSERVYAFT